MVIDSTIKAILIVLGSAFVAALIIYALAQLGEPQSVWIICKLFEFEC